MTVPRVARPTASIALVMALTACAQAGNAAAPDPAGTSRAAAAGDELVLQIRFVGGRTAEGAPDPYVPAYTVYADGRLIVDGPVDDWYPGPALPNVQLQRLDAGTVDGLVDAAVTAGVPESGDLGRPPVIDAATTRFTLVTDEGTHVRDVYALSVYEPATGVTTEQQAARHRLADLVKAVSELARPGTRDAPASLEPYTATSVAALVRPWTQPDDDLDHAERPWPGPDLPGEPLGTGSEQTCVTATGAEARALLESAASATTTTPWVDVDGRRWAVVLRPLLPHETGCADLLTS
jgi:hypothetical protein